MIREKQVALREIEEFICAKLKRYRSGAAAASEPAAARFPVFFGSFCLSCRIFESLSIPGPP